MPPWSFSSLSKFETCPKQYQLVRVLKTVKDTPGEAALWGDAVHKALEARVKDKTPLPAGMTQWEDICAPFDTADGKVLTEQQIALTRDLQPTTWFAENAWVRGIVDIAVCKPSVTFAGDYKTGKVKDNHDQLELFAALMMAVDPTITKVRTMYIWLKHGKVTKKTFTRDDLPEIWAGYMSRVRRLELAYENDKWPAHPSGLCGKWCPATKKQCSFSGRT